MNGSYMSTESSRYEYFLELMADMEARQEVIRSLPASANVLERAKLQKELGEKKRECDLIVERMRVEKVVKEHEELHPPDTETCPICLEEVPIVDIDSFARFPCCYNGVCPSCFDSVNGNEADMPVCPLCRGEIYVTPAKNKELLLKHAIAGKSEAQAKLGVMFSNGQHGYARDLKMSLKWIRLAAEQRDAAAKNMLARLYYTGKRIEKSHDKAFALMKESADMGNAESQCEIGCAYLYGDIFSEAGIGVDKSLGMKYLTLSYNGGCNEAAYELGGLFLSGEGRECGLRKHEYLQKMNLAVHYLEEAANAGCEKANPQLSAALVQRCKEVYGTVCIPGHSELPRAMFILHKSFGLESVTTEEVDEFESFFNDECHNCRKRATGKLNRCKRCRAAWYCGKECQVQHWKMGHKIDCIEHA